MRADQWLSLLIIALMMGAFLWGRYRYDIVAVSSLLAAIIVGIVPAKNAFSGFSDDIVIIVGSALIVSAAISRSGIMDVALRRFSPERRGPRMQLIILVAIVAALSAFIKNIGALAIMIPVAVQMARKSRVSPSMFLMPMSFASLLGGLMTQIGTSPNIIVSRVREEITGQPFMMFDYTPVGLALSVAGVVFLALFYKLLPERSRVETSMDEAVAIKNYTTEAKVTTPSGAIGRSVSWLQKPAGGDAMVTAIIGGNGQRRTPLPDTVLKDGDLLIIEGEQSALDKIVSEAKLQLSDRKHEPETRQDISSVEAIVGEHSRLIGVSAKDVSLFHNTGLNLLAVSRRDRRFTERLGEIKIRNGDVVVLQGDLQKLPDLLREWGCLPLVERDMKLGNARNGMIPVIILMATMGATAFGGIPVATAFFAAAFLMVVTGSVPLREVYQHLDAPILIMLAALIPISDSLRTTGTTDIIADLLSRTAEMLPPFGALALILVAAMAVTPFLNNAATVLVMAPIAATFAEKLGFRPDAFLMAVAIGAGCDFLTPIGHQCNTLVMGPGGYRFGDYARLGLPLSLIVAIVSVPILLLVWPI
ncbi:MULTISPECIES: SLC13 family permease [Rhizobium]|uniref:Transmembrane transport protein n=1 Tax=Rhizobium johnstonii (strain DSM 114642 / LMG 32736 / 3841) TaxID=216596 RepID=Q1M4M9_RHIJ3|nr:MULTISPECIES: SLC13 family permease [Rhizobium]NEI56681.1 TRAP transporter large permease subunit [Rhizobium leguminosarum]NEI85529.1 TRAP transporter large permease subunit [Rhizobium leguminosarum]NEI90663.1 TRAP transporter large permease subunit [Rhizobium leguminosarum]NEJ75559.1 TRAP transporter large permease subunit [Rhizobium leguminosarum]CAK11942.1 putative transmembrane transport protein [Rhizobium johnstonii 3841]